MTRIPIPRSEITKFCKRWKISELAFFGSVLRDDFDVNSDIDVLVSFAKDAIWSLFDHQRMEEELTGILCRRVDLTSKRAIEGSRNWIRKQSILSSAVVIYES
jgi:predicted nucleotidyltransferase